MLPLLAPAIFASAVLVFSGVIDDFVIVDLLSSNAGNTPMSRPLRSCSMQTPYGDIRAGQDR